MSADVIKDFAVKRWADTCNYLANSEEVTKRCTNLPEEFQLKLIAELKRRMEDGRD